MIARATAAPPVEAAVQCSSRRCAPSSGRQGLATSPQAKTPGAPSRRRVGRQAAVGGGRQEPSAISAAGRGADGDQQRVALQAVAVGQPDRLGPAPPDVDPAHAHAQAQVDAVRRGSGRRDAVRPRVRGFAAKGTGRASTIVTSAPRARALEATSAPTKPAPMITRRPAPFEVGPSACASSRPAQVMDVRRRRDGAGRRRGRAPVASTRCRQRTGSPPSAARRRLEVEAARARAPSRSSMSRSRPEAGRRAASGRPARASPVSSSLESAGRS